MRKPKADLSGTDTLKTPKPSKFPVGSHGSVNEKHKRDRQDTIADKKSFLSPGVRKDRAAQKNQRAGTTPPPEAKK